MTDTNCVIASLRKSPEANINAYKIQMYNNPNGKSAISYSVLRIPGDPFIHLPFTQNSIRHTLKTGYTLYTQLVAGCTQHWLQKHIKKQRYRTSTSYIE